MRWVVFAMLCLVCGCGTVSQRRQATKDWMNPDGKIKVLTTTAMIANLVEEIGGEHVDVLTLIQGDSDPHSYQLVKGDDEKLSYANTIFYNGLGLEHGATLQSYLHNHSKAVAIGDYLQSLQPGEIISVGDEVDPHIWMDMSLWKNAVPLIVHTLSEQDPIHAETYRKNGQILYAQLNKEDGEIVKYLHVLPPEKRYLVSSHDAFNYFVRHYFATNDEKGNNGWRKRVDSPMGLAPDSQLNAHEIMAIIDHMRKYHIQVLFPETNLSKEAIEKIRQAGNEKGLQLKISEMPLYGDAMGPKGSDGDTYLKMIWHNAKVIRHELE